MSNSFDIDQIKKLWNIKGDLHFVRQVANWAYFSPSTNTYVRITSSDHRSLEQLKSELNWIKHVHSCGVETVEPVESVNGQNIESIICDRKQFYIVSFTAAPGERPQLEAQNKDFFFKWGALTGNLHKAAKTYKNLNCEARPVWIKDELHVDVQKLRKKQDGPIYEKSIELEELFKSLPKDNDSFGLIHSDLHTGNFNMDSNGKFTLFDFDDSVYHWFIFDIAIVHWNFDFYKMDRDWAKAHFLEGYNSQNQLDPIWFDHLKDFHSYRVLQIYYFAIKEIQKTDFQSDIVEKFQHHLSSAYNHFDLDSKYKRHHSL